MPPDKLDNEREEFARGQSEMTARWYANVRTRETDAEAYIAKRHAIYLDRWKEGGRFVPEGARVLDIGGGMLDQSLLDYLKSKRLDYFYLDVDEATVDKSKALAAKSGFNPAQFGKGFNDRLDFPTDTFDAVFSSHCLEHSFSLSSTFSQLNRVIKIGGLLLFAVPLGWEHNPQHPYFLDANHWISFAEDAGFEIRVAQVGREYPETGYDLFIAAKKVRSCEPEFRVQPESHRKENYKFISYNDPSISYSDGMQVTTQQDAAHMVTRNWTILIRAPAHCREILPVFLRHSWSGIVQVRSRRNVCTHDLFSWFTYAMPARHCLDAQVDVWRASCRKSLADAAETIARRVSALCSRPAIIRISPAGKHPLSYSNQCVFYGFMYR